MNIAFGGPMAAGKTTCADFLVEHGYAKLSFADPVRELAACLSRGEVPEERVRSLAGAGYERALFLCSRLAREYRGCGASKAGRGRALLQELAHGFRLEVDPEVWVRAMERRLGEVAGPVVIDDVRYENELAMLLARGFLTVYVECPAEERRRRVLELYGEQALARFGHASEQAVDPLGFHLIVRGDGRLSRVRAVVLALSRASWPGAAEPLLGRDALCAAGNRGDVSVVELPVRS